MTNTQSSSSYPCLKCERTFDTQGALNGHQRSHSFFAFLGKQMPKEFREQEREEAQTKIVLAAIKHYSVFNDESHCDICTVVNEVINKPLMRDLLAYFESEATASIALKRFCLSPTAARIMTPS